MKDFDFSAIPEEFQPFARKVESWIKKNPEKAALYAAAIGAALGLIGLKRITLGAQALTKMPLVASMATAAVMKIISKEPENEEK